MGFFSGGWTKFKREGVGKFGIIMLFHDSVQSERVQLTVPQTKNKARENGEKRKINEAPIVDAAVIAAAIYCSCCCNVLALLTYSGK